MNQSEQPTFQSLLYHRAGALVAILLTFWICGAVRSQEVMTGAVKQETDCGPNLRPPDQKNTISESISWRSDHPLDEKTISDLFGKEFSRKFVAYRLCLANRGNALTTRPPPFYLILDFLRIPVTISVDGQPLTMPQIQALSKHPEFENLGFSKFNAADSGDETKGLCESANAFYKPFTPEQLLDRKIYLQLGRLEISGTKIVKLNGSQRNNVLTYVLKPTEKLSPRQYIERILVVPEEETVGSQQIRVFPCLSYVRLAAIFK